MQHREQIVAPELRPHLMDGVVPVIADGAGGMDELIEVDLAPPGVGRELAVDG